MPHLGTASVAALRQYACAATAGGIDAETWLAQTGLHRSILGSVFTTSAAENPTLTIVSLAIRQADHVAELMTTKAI